MKFGDTHIDYDTWGRTSSMLMRSQVCDFRLYVKTCIKMGEVALYFRNGTYYNLRHWLWDQQERFTRCSFCGFRNLRLAKPMHQVSGESDVWCNDCWVEQHPNGCGCGASHE